MPRSWRSYAASEREAKALREALRAYLFCPTCGSTEQCLDHMRSQSAIVMRCQGCRLKYQVRRADLAESARIKAAKCDDPKQARLLERVALLFEPVAQRADWLYTGVPDRDDADA